MLKIGNLELKYRAMLSPMASLTDISFRKFIDDVGFAGLLVTEMISAEGIRRKNEKTLQMMRSVDFQTPQFIQIFGSEPDQFIDAVKFIENETGFSGVDINMGCPKNKVVKRGGGAYLLKDPAKIAQIVKNIKMNLSIPLTVKVRLGFSEVNIFEVIKVLEQEGVDAVTVHFRLQSDSYNNKPRWEYGPMIKEQFKILLLGNGDIRTAQDATEKLKWVDGIMIGRGAVSNPLIFSEIAGNRSDLNHKMAVNRLLEIVEEYYEPEFRLQRIKAFARFLFSYHPHAKKIRHTVYTSDRFSEVKAYLKDLWF